MSAEHNAAIAAGHIEAGAVSDYLDALESIRPKPGRRVSAEMLTERRADIDNQLAEGDIKPIKRIELMQQRRDVEAQLAAIADEFLYARAFRSESDRRVRLARWIHDYNCHRHHTAVGGPPASRAHNLTRSR